LLRASTAGASVFAGLGTDLLIARLARAQALVTEPMTPAKALDELKAGNQRYSVAKKLTFDDLPSLRAQTAPKQMPFAAVLSCADSRVPVELIFDQSIGDLFVTRVAGNITTPEIFGLIRQPDRCRIGTLWRKHPASELRERLVYPKCDSQAVNLVVTGEAGGPSAKIGRRSKKFSAVVQTLACASA
jgi:hypothetical protein